MQHKLVRLFAIACVAVAMMSCGGSVDSDAQRLADLQCKAQKLIAKAQSGDMSVMEESTKLAAEATALKTELEGKYTSDDDKAKLAEAYLKAMANCK